jgi:hypothetical protein
MSASHHLRRISSPSRWYKLIKMYALGAFGRALSHVFLACCLLLTGIQERCDERAQRLSYLGGPLLCSDYLQPCSVLCLGERVHGVCWQWERVLREEVWMDAARSRGAFIAEGRATRSGEQKREAVPHHRHVL